jgi:hypothetical protein
MYKQNFKRLTHNSSKSNILLPSLLSTHWQGKHCSILTKEEYRPCSSLVPENVKQQFNKSIALMSVCATEYATNAVNHVAANFGTKSVLYFFIRFNNNNNDTWHLENATVANRKKIALYCYHKAAQLEAHWPENLPGTVT